MVARVRGNREKCASTCGGHCTLDEVAPTAGLEPLFERHCCSFSMVDRLAQLGANVAEPGTGGELGDGVHLSRRTRSDPVSAQAFGLAIDVTPFRVDVLVGHHRDHPADDGQLDLPTNQVGRSFWTRCAAGDDGEGATANL